MPKVTGILNYELWLPLGWFVMSTKVLVDDRATEDAKNAAAMQWDLLNPCCARPGFARELRSQQITGHQLCQGSQSGLLRGLACSARTTVADCELRHARNRKNTNTNGRTGYPHFCVSSILDESALQQKHSLASALSRDQVQNVTRKLLESFFVRAPPNHQKIIIIIIIYDQWYRLL